MSIIVNKQDIYNPELSDEISKRRIINGECSNLINFSIYKYKWAITLYKKMIENFWISEKVQLNRDKITSLSPNQKNAYDGNLSSLTFLDSGNTANLNILLSFITDPNISSALVKQAEQEVLHSEAYSKMYQTSYSTISEIERVYNIVKNNEVLKRRNEYIINIFKTFEQNKTIETFADSALLTYILEGFYFYNGFYFFYNLADQGLMPNTAVMIQLIERDELVHLELFRQIIKGVNEENNNILSEERVHDMFRQAIVHETEWAISIFGDGIPGITPKTIELFTKFLANKRITQLGFSPLFDEKIENPYSHLEKFSAEKFNDQMQNFFERTVNHYTFGAMDWETNYNEVYNI